MEYALKERIGKPGLFVGRKKELAFFLQWIDDIKQEKSKSTAMLARRKMGKTAIMERLFNIIFNKNDGVIPFYYEIKEAPMWVGDFCRDFFLTFIYQYIAFKSRKSTYMGLGKKSSLPEAKKDAINEGLDYLITLIENVEYSLDHDFPDSLWETVRQAPQTVAHGQKEYIVQLIDEFQFLTDKIYWDKAKKNPAKELAGGYLSTAESKIAPLLVSGSWVGWLMNLLIMMLPARFKFRPLENMSEDEAIEMVFKYSQFFAVPVTDETAYLIAHLSEGSPFYISAILRSDCPDKDLANAEGLARTLEFETLNDRGEIKSTWMEYVATAFNRVNDKNAKNIVLYLCKNRDREVTRKELLEKLQLGMTDAALENKLKALVKADIIQQGSSNYDYRGVQDNIFDKVFRGVYQKEIDHFEPGEKIFDPEQIKKEYQKTLNEQKAQYYKLQGKFNYHKGYYAEYAIVDQLMYHGRERNVLLKSITRNLPMDFEFCDYESVWRYNAVVEYAKGLNVDILARAKPPGQYSIIGEVKNRDTKKFSKEEAAAFLDKFETVKRIENLEPVVGFIFSRKGFTKETETYLQEKGIAYSEDEKWLA